MSKGVLKEYLRVAPSSSKFEKVKPMSDRFSALFELSKRSAALDASESKPDRGCFELAVGLVAFLWLLANLPLTFGYLVVLSVVDVPRNTLVQ
jgi:hypothetical protein